MSFFIKYSSRALDSCKVLRFKLSCVVSMVITSLVNSTMNPISPLFISLDYVGFYVKMVELWTVLVVILVGNIN